MHHVSTDIQMADMFTRPFLSEEKWTNIPEVDRDVHWAVSHTEAVVRSRQQSPSEDTRRLLYDG